jgi:hypothetical protein
MSARHAIVVLPPASFGLIRDDGLRRWLSRGEIDFIPRDSGLLQSVLAEIGAPAMTGGQAALRYAGQTGAPPAGWMAAADPVSLRPRMRDIVIDALPPAILPQADLQEIYATLQAHLAHQDGLRIENIGHFGYLFSAQAFATPAIPPDLLNGSVPDPLQLAGGSPDVYHRLNSEFQMLLHDHPVNTRRQANGLPPINGLWIWQGGTAEYRDPFPLPPLYADDPLFGGCWLSCDAPPRPWPGSISACAGTGSDCFVAVVPDEADPVPDPWLGELRTLVEGGRIRRLSIYSRDGLYAKLGRFQRLRLWRPVSPMLEERTHDE